MIRGPIPPLPPRVLFGSDEEYRAAKENMQKMLDQRSQDERFVIAAHIVAVAAGMILCLGTVGFLLFTIGGFEALAWAAGSVLLLGSLTYEIGKRL